MRQKKLQISRLPTPYEYGIQVIEGKWRSRLLTALHYYHAMRYVEMRQCLKPISDTVLAGTLRELLGKGLVEKVELDDASVGYMLTKEGEELIPVLLGLARWAERWHHIEASPVHEEGERRLPVNPFRTSAYYSKRRTVRREDPDLN